MALGPSVTLAPEANNCSLLGWHWGNCQWGEGAMWWGHGGVPSHALFHQGAAICGP